MCTLILIILSLRRLVSSFSLSLRTTGVRGVLTSPGGTSGVVELTSSPLSFGPSIYCRYTCVDVTKPFSLKEEYTYSI